MEFTSLRSSDLGRIRNLFYEVENEIILPSDGDGGWRAAAVADDSSGCLLSLEEEVLIFYFKLL